MWFKKKNKPTDISNTWHVCEHDWEVQAVNGGYGESHNPTRGGYSDFICSKCHVCCTTRFNNEKLILVNPETNTPMGFDPWSCGKPKPLSIGITKNHERG